MALERTPVYSWPRVPAATAPHRRYNPLLDEWVLVSPHRLERPWQGQVEPEGRETRLAYDAACYLCPGNRRASGERNPAYPSTFAFDNDFPALLPPGEAPAGSEEPGLLVSEPAGGRCRVLCFSPRHDLTLAEMDAQAIRGVVDAWASETETLGSDPQLRYVQVFENKGAMMGCSNPHPHCQVWATSYVPLTPARKLAAQRAWFERRRSDLVGDYLDAELRRDERVVCRNASWVALVPYWAVWPFEVMLVPTRRAPDLPSLTDAERDGLADLLRRVGTRYDNLFRTSFPYSLGFHGRPTDGEEHPWWRLHAVYYPPLLRSATVRKFLVGFELTAEPQRDLTAEHAAARLRALGETHYRTTP
jgi:UDPglucose--hexose-1-phosphate uridylyltransferase